MEVKMKPVNIIETKLEIQKGGSAHAFFTSTCALHMDKYVPKRDADLRKTVVEGGNITENVGVDTIIYTQNYAMYQYKGEREDGTRKIQKRTTPNTYSYWDKKMVAIEGKNVTKEVANYIKKYGGK